LVRLLVVVQPGVLDLDVVDLGGRAVLLLDQAADLAAGLRPGRDVRRVAPQETNFRAHGASSVVLRARGENVIVTDLSPWPTTFLAEPTPLSPRCTATMVLGLAQVAALPNGFRETSRSACRSTPQRLPAHDVSGEQATSANSCATRNTFSLSGNRLTKSGGR